MRTLCVIPARLGSTRLPRKMLARINGKPIVQMTYEGARGCPDIDKVIVATDSEEIAAVVREVGGDVIMTPVEIKTGSDRTAYVAQAFPDMDVIINLQGDEPFIRPSMLTELLSPYLQGENPPMATLGYDLLMPHEYEDPGIVKVILDQRGYAMYFSRSPIPYFRQQVAKVPVLHHMGLYAFERNFLLQFTQMAQTPFELAESLEQLRALENGYKIRVVKTESRTLEINTLEELERAQLIAAKLQEEGQLLDV